MDAPDRDMRDSAPGNGGQSDPGARVFRRGVFSSGRCLIAVPLYQRDNHRMPDRVSDRANAPGAADRFRELVGHVVNVPKTVIDEREAE